MENSNIDLLKVTSQEDVFSTAVLASAIWKQHYTPIIGIEQVNYMLDKFQSETAINDQIKNGFEYFLAVADGPIGYLSLKTEKDTLFISKIYLVKSERGKGYGKNMMNFAKTYAKQKKLEKLRLTVNKYNLLSIEAYEKMGFTKKRAVVFDIGNGYIMDDYEMELTL